MLNPEEFRPDAEEDMIIGVGAARIALREFEPNCGSCYHAREIRFDLAHFASRGLIDLETACNTYSDQINNCLGLGLHDSIMPESKVSFLRQMVDKLDLELKSLRIRQYQSKISEHESDPDINYNFEIKRLEKHLDACLTELWEKDLPKYRGIACYIKSQEVD